MSQAPSSTLKATPETSYDVIIVGAGGAGLFCALHAGRRGRRVLVLDHAAKLGGKILISGGGRCNFTNTGADAKNYVSKNPHFAKSALARFRPEQFIAMVDQHGIAYHEKKLGQQFCDTSAKEIVRLLETECAESQVEIRLQSKVDEIESLNPGFALHANGSPLTCESLVIATGGLSIPKLGATGFGYSIAEKFGLKLVARDPALDGFVFSDADAGHYRDLSGLSLDVVMSAGGLSFRENILFTHAGLSGPAALQASLHWNSGEEVEINLLPEMNWLEHCLEEKKKGNRAYVRNLLSHHLPARFADRFCDLHFPSTTPLPQVSEKALAEFSNLLHHWKWIPKSTVGYSKAEVTRGGVDTDELSSKTLESKKVPGLYFIGEVVDVTGWLGGYNFQWAWASGFAAGSVV